MQVKLADLNIGTMFRHDGKLYERGNYRTLEKKTIICSPSVGGQVQKSANLVVELAANTIVTVQHD